MPQARATVILLLRVAQGPYLDPLPQNLEQVIDDAWVATQSVPGFLLENEARFLGRLAACLPAKGTIVEIGSFKGRSTVMLTKVAAYYGLGPVVSIDPHTHELSTGAAPGSLPSTYDDFLSSLRIANVEEHVEIHRALSADVARTWQHPIRFLWIDGDHTYAGAKADFDGFAPFLQPGAVVALHDSLNDFPGPIRVFVEDILRSKQFGPAGFVHSIAWSQFRPADARGFAPQKAELASRASRLLPLAQQGPGLRGLAKIRYKLLRSRIPRQPISASELAALLT